MSYMGPMGPISPGTPQWHQADQQHMAQAQYVFNNSGHGAIGYSPSTGMVGTSWNYSNQTGAEQTALQGLPNDARLHWAHHGFVALARGSVGHGMGHGSSAIAAMDSALACCPDPDARITELIDTKSGQLDPGEQRYLAEQRAAMWQSLTGSIGRYFKRCLIVVLVLVTADIGLRLPALALVLIALVICYAIWRRRHNRRR